MTQKNTNQDLEIEDITLIGDDDITVPREIESVTMEDDAPRLKPCHIITIQAKFGDKFKRPAFVATMQGLGIAVEHEFGYWPIPDYWYSENDFHKASAYADELNREVFSLEPDDAMTIITSTMRGGE